MIDNYLRYLFSNFTMGFVELILIFAAGVLGGAFGTLVGAGNILTIPLVIFLGYPIHTAIAVNRFGTVGLTAFGYAKFREKGLVNHKIGFFMSGFTLVGAYFGTKIVLQTGADVLEKIVGIIIIVMIIFAVFNKNIGINSKKIGKRHMVIGAVLSLLLGMYIGFIGLGAGTFLIYLGVLVFGQTFLQSTATIKIPGGIASALSALIFWLNGKLIWDVAVVLFVSMSIGSYVGAHYSDRIGNIWLRRLVLAVSGLMAITLFF